MCVQLKFSQFFLIVLKFFILFLSSAKGFNVIRVNEPGNILISFHIRASNKPQGFCFRISLLLAMISRVRSIWPLATPTRIQDKQRFANVRYAKMLFASGAILSSSYMERMVYTNDIMPFLSPHNEILTRLPVCWRKKACGRAIFLCFFTCTIARALNSTSCWQDSFSFHGPVCTTTERR